MAKRRIPLWLALIVVTPALVLLLVAGLWIYMIATATPIHPDPQAVPSAAQSPPQAKWTAAVEQARQIVRAGVAEGNLPGLSVAVGAGGDIVWAEGFGFADLESRSPMTRGSVFRVGSVSKLFTALSVMQLVERGKLDLSRPIAEVLPELRIQGAFPEPARLRHFLSHVSGFPRESPVGSYFDGSGAGPAQALASLRLIQR